MKTANTILTFLGAVCDCEHVFRDIDQKIYVREEMAELLKEFSKEERNKGSSEHIVEEEIDLMNTLIIDLRRRGIPFEYIFSGDKLKRAVRRYEENGEL